MSIIKFTTAISHNPKRNMLHTLTVLLGNQPISTTKDNFSKQKIINISQQRFNSSSRLLNPSTRQLGNTGKNSNRRPPNEAIPIETLTPSSTQRDISNTLYPYYQSQSPVIIRNGPNSKDVAVTSWTDLNYLRKTVHEDTLCFVEMNGGNYSKHENDHHTQNNRRTDTSDDISMSSQIRSEISFGQYLDYITLFQEKYGSENDGDDTRCKVEKTDLIYLAQNDLFPSLHNDITLPSFLYHPFSLESSSSLSKESIMRPFQEHTTTSITTKSWNHQSDKKSSDSSLLPLGHGKLYNTMLWLGPKGCTSPLHYDPLDNLFMQYVGRKQIFLLPPLSTRTSTNINYQNDGSIDKKTQQYSESEEYNDINVYYAGHNNNQYNTSPIDLLSLSNNYHNHDEEKRNSILENYPNFIKAPPVLEGIVHPGDLLFIPSKWWHYVHSLDLSISVNAWWR